MIIFFNYSKKNIKKRGEMSVFLSFLLIFMVINALFVRFTLV